MGAEIWALDNMLDKMEHPEWFDYAARIQAYGKKHPDGSPMTGWIVDRAFKPGERFTWEGYIYAGEYLKRLKPDLLVGGHSFVMDRPARFIECYRRWCYAMRDAFRALSSERDYRYWFDPFWVRAEPYRVSVHPGERVEVQRHMRNFRRGRQAHRIGIHTPPGLVAEPTVLEGRLAGRAREAFPIVFKALPEAAPGLRLVAFDVTLDGRRYGQRFDALVNVTEDAGTPRP